MIAAFNVCRVKAIDAFARRLGTTHRHWTDAFLTLPSARRFKRTPHSATARGTDEEPH